jgi:UDP-glucose 4-epimerase
VIKGSRVLITGGAGMIGSQIADRLVEQGAAEIVVLDNFERGRKENLTAALASGRVQVVVGDLRDREVVNSVMRGVDLVFHQAALRITQCAADPRAAMETMADGTFNVLEAAVAHGVRKVVAASSASIYGMAEVFPTSESHHAYGNRTLYGALKTFNEGLLRSFHDTTGLDYVALRYFNVYGPRMDIYGVYTEVMVRWMERIERGEPPLIFGDGRQTMDFVHCADIARANLLAAVAPVTDAVFNIGSGRETSLLQLARGMARAMGRPTLRPVLGPERAVNPVPRRLADVSAAREQLGFEARIGLAAGLRDLVAWWRSESVGTPEKATA